MLNSIIVALAGSAVAAGAVPEHVFDGHSGTFNGFAYEISEGLDGTVVNGVIDGPATTPGYTTDDPDRWVVLPKRDRMTDVVRWYIVHYQSGLMLSMTPGGSIGSVCVIGADFPGRPVAIRVGENPAQNYGEDCSPANPALKAQLIRGGRLLTRRYEWPDDYPKDVEGRADGFREAVALYRFLRAR